MPQINIIVSEEIKGWAQQRARGNYQSLSKFIVMLIDKEKERAQKEKREAKDELD